MVGATEREPPHGVVGWPPLACVEGDTGNGLWGWAPPDEARGDAGNGPWGLVPVAGEVDEGWACGPATATRCTDRLA